MPSHRFSEAQLAAALDALGMAAPRRWDTDAPDVRLALLQQELYAVVREDYQRFMGRRITNRSEPDLEGPLDDREAQLALGYMQLVDAHRRFQTVLDHAEAADEASSEAPTAKALALIAIAHEATGGTLEALRPAWYGWDGQNGDHLGRGQLALAAAAARLAAMAAAVDGDSEAHGHRLDVPVDWLEGTSAEQPQPAVARLLAAAADACASCQRAALVEVAEDADATAEIIGMLSPAWTGRRDELKARLEPEDRLWMYQMTFGTWADADTRRRLLPGVGNANRLVFARWAVEYLAEPLGTIAQR